MAIAVDRQTVIARGDSPANIQNDCFMQTDAELVSTAQVAKALGVGVSSVKRWVDDGVLPAFKTAGGHRKLRLTDVLRLAKEKEFPRLDLKQLPFALPLSSQLRDRDAAGALYRHLRHGDADAAEGAIRGAYLGGMTLGSLADNVVRPAMTKIGDEWAAGRIDVLHEHRATDVCVQAILGLKRILEDRGDTSAAPMAIGGSPQAQGHSLANLLAEVVLIEAGWSVLNLGVNTPLGSFRAAIREFHPQLIWLSISPLADPEAFLDDYRDLYRDAQRADVAVAVGGLGLTEHLRERMPYTTFGDGLSHLAAFARSLHPIRKPRRRGRPPGGKPV